MEKFMNEICAHRWHLANTARGISNTSPRYQDDVLAFLYCPKCLAQKTLIYKVNKERSGIEQIDNPLIDFIETGDSEKSLKDRYAISYNRVKKNLEKLGYGKEIEALIKAATHEFVVRPELLVEVLKDDHKVMATTIINSELMG